MRQDGLVQRFSGPIAQCHLHLLSVFTHIEGPKLTMTKGRVLVIAGSDSSGGAGLEADQKVIAAHGCYAMTATTALTAQNTLGVEDTHYTPPEFVRKLIYACVSDVGVDVVKTGNCFPCVLKCDEWHDEGFSFRGTRVLILGKGMLASAETIKVVADCLREWNVETTVIDPV